MNKTLKSLLFLLPAQFVLAQSSQVFTSSGNFTVPSGITSITIEVVGAGGNGAGNGGGGGGGGGYARGVYTVTPAAVLPVTIGNGGGGSSGGMTSVASLISATGGANGTTVSNPSIGGGGAGGNGINGNIVNRSGGNGGGGYWTYFGGGGGGAAGSVGNGANGGNTVAWTGSNCLTPGGTGGAGGGAPGGNGGKGAGFVDNSCSVADPAAAGSNYGGGGGGGNGNSSPAQTGAPGYCRIEYGCTAPNAPGFVATSPTLCSGSTGTMIASGSGTINWYTVPSGGSPIGSGTVFITSPLTTTTTFYASAETCTSSVQRTAFTISVSPVPTLAMIVSAPIICEFEPIIFTATGAQSYTWSTGSTGPMITFTPQGTVIYPPIVVGSANGCTNSASMASLAVNPQPTLSIIPATTLCAGQIITYTVSGADSYNWANGPQTSTYAVVVSTASVFSVTGMSAEGCIGTASISQTVIASPTLAIMGKTLVCAGETMSMSASGAGSYSWTGNGAVATISVTPAVSTVYTLTGTNAEGCSTTLTRTVSVDACLALRKGTSVQKFLVFPNPSAGLVTISSESDQDLKVVSASGQLVKKVSLNSLSGWTVTLDGLASGIYFISDAGNTHIQKIVIE